MQRGRAGAAPSKFGHSLEAEAYSSAQVLRLVAVLPELDCAAQERADCRGPVRGDAEAGDDAIAAKFRPMNGERVAGAVGQSRFQSKAVVEIIVPPSDIQF